MQKGESDLKRILLIVAAVMVFAAGCNSPFNFSDVEAEPRVPIAFENYTVPPNFIPQVLLITALGDSLSEGVGDELFRAGYVGRLALEMREWPGVYGTAVENTAKRGRRSDQLLAMFRQGELTGPIAEADYVVMTIGGNDIMRVVKRDLLSLNIEAFADELVLYENRLQTIFSYLREINPNVPVVVMGLYNPFSLITQDIPEFDAIVAAYNDSIEEVAEADTKACFVPVDDLFIGNDNLVYHTDFFHPNSKGYDLMTERTIERMEECGFVYQQ